ncbi:MAG: TGS domain-containing protein, partial [Pseudomonadota bacterium]|nr:TGS domain-containing protein [Pseudomonadota bacterium]
MITLTLPDGATQQFDKPLTGIAFAESISKSLAKKALALKINGKAVDLATVID